MLGPAGPSGGSKSLPKWCWLYYPHSPRCWVSSAGGRSGHAVQEHGDANSLVLTIDPLMFVLMAVEILHTVRVSFRSGTSRVRTVPDRRINRFNQMSAGH